MIGVVGLSTTPILLLEGILESITNYNSGRRN